MLGITVIKSIFINLLQFFIEHNGARVRSEATVLSRCESGARPEANLFAGGIVCCIRLL